MPAEIKFSLGTTDLDEARLRCNEHNLRLEREWRYRLVGTPPDELSHLRIVALAGEFYAETVEAHRDDPGAANAWQKKMRDVAEVRHRRFLPKDGWLPIVYGQEARAFLEKRNIRLVGDRFDAFIKAFAAAKEHSSQVLARNAQGDYRPDTEAAKYPKFEAPRPEQQFDALWAEFSKAKALSAGTRKKWEPYFRELIKRTGSSDMSRVTEQHLLDWRDQLLASKLSLVTVKDGYIAAAKSFFGWAKRMKRIPVDPARDVNVEISEKLGVKKRGFTDKEAAVILSAALAPMGVLMSAENAAARKWVPWICAYTGARVNEITQLRALDVKIVDGIKCIHITPEAGTVKGTEPRTVPLHPHLVEMGFFDWARRKKGKRPLFYSLERQRKVDRKVPTYVSVGSKLAEWVRGLGIKDPRVAPNHGWRHRFKTKGRKVRMDPEVRDAIQGHAPRTEGEDYGEFPVGVMLREIRKLPRYKVVASERRDGRRRDQKQRTGAVA